MSSERISCGEFLVVDLDDSTQVNQGSINTKSMSARQLEDHESRIAAYKRLNPTVVARPTMPRLSIDTLMNFSAKYEKSHPGKKLAHAFPSNDQTSKLPPRSQHTQSGGGLAIPYQNEQQSKMTRDSTEPPIWVTPVPATFFEGENQEHKTQQEIIKHYIAGLYFQVGHGNGICVPVRNINGLIGSVLNECDFTHPIKPSGAQSLLAGKEYAWGAGIDKLFCKNHGEFLEAELNKLDAFMNAMRKAPSREAQEKIIQALDNEYAIAFRNALENPEKEWYGMYQRGRSLGQAQSMDAGIAADISPRDIGNQGKKRLYDDDETSKKRRSDEQNEPNDTATSAIISSGDGGTRGKKRSYDEDQTSKKRKPEDEPFISASSNPVELNQFTPFIQLQRNELQLSLAGKLSPQQLQMVMESLAQASAKATSILSSSQQPEPTENLWLSDPRLKRGKKDAANLTLFTQANNPQAIATDQDAFVNMRDITAIGPQARHVTTISMVQKAFSRFINSSDTEQPMLISDVIKALLLHRLDFFIEEIEPQNKMQKKLTREEVTEMFFQYFLHDPKLMSGMRSKEIAEDVAARIFRLYSKAAYIALPEEGNTPVIKNESSVAANALKKFENYDDSIKVRMEPYLTQEELTDCIEQLYLIFDYKPLDPSTRAERLNAIFGAVSIVNANTRAQQIPKELHKEYDAYVKNFIAKTKASPKITEKDRKFLETIERKEVSTLSGKELKEFEKIMNYCDIEYRKSNKYSNAVIDHWRHEREPIDRLYEVTTRHLNMMFLLCPSLEEYQRDVIVKTFLNKIANEYKMSEEERIALADNVLTRLRDRNFDYDHAVSSDTNEVLKTEFTTVVDELVHVYQEEAHDYVSELIEHLRAAEREETGILMDFKERAEERQIVTAEDLHDLEQNSGMMEVEQSDLDQHSVEMGNLSENGNDQLSDRLKQIDFNPIAEEIYQWQKRVNSEIVQEIIKFVKSTSKEEDVELIKKLQQGILKNRGLSAENIATILTLLHKSTSLRQTDLINIVSQLETLHIKVDTELVHAISGLAQRLSQDDDIALIKKLQEGPLKNANLLDEDIGMILNVLHKPYRDISEYDFDEILKTLYGQFQDRLVADALIAQIYNSVNGEHNKDVIASLEQELLLASPQFNDRSRAAILLYHQFLHGEFDSQDDDDKSFGADSEDSEESESDLEDEAVEDFDSSESNQDLSMALGDKNKESAGIKRSLELDNCNLDNQRNNQNYQLQSHDINYVAKLLLPENVVYIDVQQAHIANPAIGLVRTFSEEEGLVQQSLQQGKSVVSTFNKDANHWVAFRLIPITDGKLVVLYKDSYGAPPPDSFLQALKSLKRLYPNIIVMPNHAQREQFDVVNCGLFALKNMQLLAHLEAEEINKWYKNESFPAFYQPDPEYAQASSLYLENIKIIRNEFGDIYRRRGEEMEVAAVDLREFVNQRQSLADEVASALSAAMRDQKFNMRCEARTAAGNTQEWRFDIEFVGATSEMQLLSVKRFLEQCEISCLVQGNHLQFSPEAGDKILAHFASREMPEQSVIAMREAVLISGSEMGDQRFVEKNKSDTDAPEILARCIANAKNIEELCGYLNRLKMQEHDLPFLQKLDEVSRSLTIPIFSEASDIDDLINKLNQLPKNTVIPGSRFLIKIDDVVSTLQNIKGGASNFNNLPRSFGIRDAVKDLMTQTPKQSLNL